MPGCSACRPPPLSILLTEETEGRLWGSQAPWRASCSRISQANIVGCSCFMRRIFFTTLGVATCCKQSAFELHETHSKVRQRLARLYVTPINPSTQRPSSPARRITHVAYDKAKVGRGLSRGIIAGIDARQW
jgi:hypothetical protein